MKKFSIGNLEIPLPIIQGGMGVCVSLSGLAAAVANEGGIGVISSVGIGMTEADYKRNFSEANKTALRKEIRKAREMTDGILGVNIMMAVTDYEDLLQISIEEGIDVVFVGAGLPLRMPEYLNNTQTKFVPKVSSSRAAKILFRHWSEKYNRVPDGIVIEGSLCGGHVGFKKADIESKKSKSLAEIVSETVTDMDSYEQKYGIEIPVIAAGGIYYGNDIAQIMKSGAKAVKMGTRFVTTTECDVSDAFKQNYVNCTKEDITIIDSPVGLPGRVISNDFIKEIQAGKQKPVNCQWKCLKTCDFRNVQFCIAEALFNAAQGDFTHGFSFAGTNAYLAKEILSVKETIKQIKQEFQNEIHSLNHSAIKTKLEIA